MKTLKDNFSVQASFYKHFRPVYPKALYERILEEVENRGHAWDCATGNGQVAQYLSRSFEKVSANDVSIKQLNLAPRKKNIIYYNCRAEETPFPDETFDLIAIGQALHWFDFKYFYEEVNRVAKPDAVIAAWTYKLLHLGGKADTLLKDFYHHTMEGYWDEERKFVDDEYMSIPFPFNEIEPEESFSITAQYSLRDLEGYLNSWSAVQKYIKANDINPVGDLIAEMGNYWRKDELKRVEFPLFLRMGKV